MRAFQQLSTTIGGCGKAGFSRARQLLIATPLVVGALVAAALLADGAGAAPPDEYDPAEVVTLEPGEAVEPGGVDFNLAQTCEDVRSAAQSWFGVNPTRPLPLKLPGFTLGVRFVAGKLAINCGEQNYADLSRAVLSYQPDAGDAVILGVNFRLDWQDGSDAVPDVFLSLSSESLDGSIFAVSDLAQLSAQLLDGFGLDPGDLPGDISLRNLQFAFKWSEASGYWLDVATETLVTPAGPDPVSSDITAKLLVSATSRPAAAPVVLVGVRVNEAAGEPTFNLGGLFRGDIGEYLGSIELPSMNMAFVRPATETVTLDQLPVARSIPREFFRTSDGSEPQENQIEYDGKATVSAQVALDSFGAGVRDTFGYGDGATADLVGRADITFDNIANDSVSARVTQANLDITLPHLDGSQATLLPDWLRVGETALSVNFDPAIPSFVFGFSTSAELDIPDASQAGGNIVLAPQLEGEVAILGTGEDGFDLTMGFAGEIPGSETSPAWPHPFGQDWLDLHSLGADAVVVLPADGDPLVDAAVTGKFAVGPDNNKKEFLARVALQRESTTTSFELGLELQDSIALTEVVDLFGVTLPGDFDVAVGPVAAGDPPVRVTARIDLPDAGSAMGQIAINAPGTFTIAGTPFGVNFLVSLETLEGGGYQVVAGARTNNGIRVSELLGTFLGPDLVGALGDFDFELPAVGVLVNLEDLDEPSAGLSVEEREFFDPLYGCDPDDDACTYDVVLASGVHLLSSVVAPDDPAIDGVFEAFWLDGAPPVLFDAFVGLPGAGEDISFDGVGLALKLPINPGPDVRPDWFRRADLSVEIGFDGGLKFGLGGHLGIKMRDESATSESTCVDDRDKHWLLTGATGTERACYDVLDFRVSAEVIVGFDGVSFVLTGTIESEGGWRGPFGLEFLEFGGVAIQLTVTVPPTGNVSFLIGFYVSGALILDPEAGFGKDITGSFVVGFRVLQATPFVIPEFRGMRLASRNGIELADIERLYDIARNQAAQLKEAIENPPPGTIPPDSVPPALLELATLPELSLDDLGIPNISLRNIELMIGLGDFPAVCIETGVRLGAELYFGASPTTDVPVETPSNCPSEPIADPIECLNAAEPCAAAVALDVGLDGISLAGSMGAIDVGPLHWNDALFEFLLRPDAQKLRVRGGASIDGLADGTIDLTIAPNGFAFLGDVVLFPQLEDTDTPAFRALIEGEAEVDVVAFFTDPTSLPANFNLHVVLQSDFDALIRGAVTDPLRALRDTALTVETFYEELKASDGDAIEALRMLPQRLRDLDVEVPTWLDDPDELDVIEALVTIDDLLTTAGFEPPTLGELLTGTPLPTPVALEGVWIPSEPVCWGVLGVVPGVVIDGTCWEVPPEFNPLNWEGTRGFWQEPECYSVPPLLGYADGEDCYLFEPITEIPGLIDIVPGLQGVGYTEFLTDYLEPLLSNALQLVGLPPGVTFSEALGTLVGGLEGAQVPLELTCVDFNFEAAGGALPNTDLRIAAHVFGYELGIDIGWDFGQPWQSQVEPLLDALITQLFAEPADPSCAQIGTTSIGGSFGGGSGGTDGTGGPTVADRSFSPAVSPGSVTEGEALELSGTYGSGLSNSEPATIEWGDGSVDAVTVADLRLGLPHVFVDDNPTATESDTHSIAVTIDGTTETVLVGVRNAAPVITLTPLTPRVDEGSTLEVQVDVVDPGLADTLSIQIVWGDGSTETVDPTSTLTTADFPLVVSHTYVDDDPTKLSADQARIAATVRDDDGGTGRTVTQVWVDNVAPSSIAITPTSASQVNEGDTVTYEVEWFDPGVADQHLVQVEWGDGTTTTTRSAGSPATISHLYGDDALTSAPADDYPVAVTVTDDDGGSATKHDSVTVHNVDPVVSVGAEDGSTSITVQYSDPIGGDPETSTRSRFIVTAFDVTPDVLTLTTTFAMRGETPSAEVPDWLTVSSPTCVGDATHQACTWYLSGAPDPVSGIHTDIAPGTYDLSFTVADDDQGSGSATFELIVEPEDARVWYVGPTFAATDSVNDPDVEVELRATARDITSVEPQDPKWDPWPGDIRMATLTFVDRDDPSAAPFGCARADEPPVPVDEVFSDFDVFMAATSIGVGTCEWLATVDDAHPYTVGSVVGGYYVRDGSEDDAVVTVARPLDEFITGGGYLVLTDSAGEYAGDAGTHANYGFGVKFNKKGTNLQGRATLIVRIGDRTYQIKSNAIDSLGVYPGADLDPPDDFLHAEFEAKANLTDVTDPANPISIAGNLVLQMRMTDASQDGATDSVAFTLWDIRRQGNGKHATYTQLLEFSSSWDGNQSQEQTVAGGNILVHD